MSNRSQEAGATCTRYTAEVSEEQAALYVLEALSKEETSDFESHLSDGCAVCEDQVILNREMLAAEAFSAFFQSPPSSVRGRLLERVREEEQASRKTSASPAPPTARRPQPSIQLFKNWTRPPADTSDFYIRRSGQGEWESAAPGVQFKKLAVDSERSYVTMLVRMDAGAAYPSHRHAGAEECFVIEGDLHVGDEVLGPGDYQFAGSGSDHGVQSTENGCLLLIMSSQKDELI